MICHDFLQAHSLELTSLPIHLWAYLWAHPHCQLTMLTPMEWPLLQNLMVETTSG